jgi:hypothetical protein
MGSSESEGLWLAQGGWGKQLGSESNWLSFQLNSGFWQVAGFVFNRIPPSFRDFLFPDRLFSTRFRLRPLIF